MRKTLNIKAVIIISISAICLLTLLLLWVFLFSYTDIIGQSELKSGVKQIDDARLVEIEDGLAGYKETLENIGIEYKVAYNWYKTNPPEISVVIKVRKIDFGKANEAIQPFDQESYDNWRKELATNSE